MTNIILAEGKKVSDGTINRRDTPSVLTPSPKKSLWSELQTILQSTDLSAPAFSEQTVAIGRRVSDLRIPPSPGSLTAPALAPAQKKSLEERLFDATARVKILTSQVAMHLDRAWRERLFAQLDALHRPDDWEEEDEPVQQGSFSTFLKAIVQLKPAKRPGLGLSYTGNLIASWSEGHNNLTVEFQSKDRVLWIIGLRVDDESEQIAGQTTVARLETMLKPYDPIQWFGDD